MTRRYRYQPFEDAPNQIRLLTVLGGKDEDDMHIELTSFNREEVTGEYDAISYTWGQPDQTYTIFVNGETLELRHNAWLFLRHLRKTRLTKHKIWIDAICIDQQNLKEKEALIPGIGQVFHSAAGVLIWLDWTSINIDLEQEVIDFFESADDTTLCDLYDVKTRFPNVDDASKLVDSLMKYAYHVYWTRLWVVQEMALATPAYFIMKDRLVPAAAIANVKVWCWGRGPKFDESFCNSPDTAAPSSYVSSDFDPGLLLPNMETVNERRDLYHLLSHYGQQQCEDARDKVYGLLSLVNEGDIPRVDYEVSVEELFMLTLRCIEINSHKRDGLHFQFRGEQALAVVNAFQLDVQSYSLGISQLDQSLRDVILAQRFGLALTPQQLVPAAGKLHSTDGQNGKTPLDLDGCETYYISSEHPDLQRYSSRSQAPPDDLDREACSLYCHLGNGRSSLLVSWNTERQRAEIDCLIAARGMLANGSYDLSMPHSVMPTSKDFLDNIELQLNSPGNGKDLWRANISKLNLQLSILDMLHYGESLTGTVESSIAWYFF